MPFQLRFILFAILIVNNLVSQTPIYQNQYEGGVIWSTVNYGLEWSDRDLTFQLPPNAVIDQIYLIPHISRNTEYNFEFEVNGVLIRPDEATKISSAYHVLNEYDRPNDHFFIDFVKVGGQKTNHFEVSVKNQPDDCYQCYLRQIGFLILYTFPNSKPVNLSIYSYNGPLTQVLKNNLDLINPYLPDSSFFVSLNGQFSCECGMDAWTKAIINSTDTIGDGGGIDPQSPKCFWSGGSFYYSSLSSSGIFGDTANDRINLDDLVFDLNKLPNGIPDQLNFTFPSNSFTSGNSHLINPIILAYQSSCDLSNVNFPESDTICKGESHQFNASGGVSYDWSPKVGLSCYDCPNPKVLSNSTKNWFLTIHANDSCSATQPIHVVVHQTGMENVRLQKTICAEETGKILTGENPDPHQSFSYSLNSASPILAGPDGYTFENLPAGTHTLTQYSGHCSLDTSIVIPDSQIVVANFLPSPESGSVPFKCYFKDLSTQATDLTWYVDGHEISEDFYTHLFEEGGEHEVMLIAHRKDSACADTAYMWVLAYEDLVLTLPNIITANGDGINDELLVRSNQPASLQYSIVNRWGTTVHQGELEINEEEPLSLWNGGELNEGTYFLKVIATPSQGQAKEPRSFETFFQLERP